MGIVPAAGSNVEIAVTLAQGFGGDWSIQFHNVGWDGITPPAFYGTLGLDLPYGTVYPVVTAKLVRDYLADLSVHVPTTMEFQPGPYSRSKGVVAAATLWGFHSAGVQPTFGRVWGISDETPVLSRFVPATYLNPATIEPNILKVWYQQNYQEAAILAGFLYPWERIGFDVDDASDRLRGMRLPAGTRMELRQEKDITMIVSVNDGRDVFDIQRYYSGTNLIEDVDVYIPYVVDCYGYPADGTNRFEVAGARSADVKSTVTQVIDWNFNSLTPVTTETPTP